VAKKKSKSKVVPEIIKITEASDVDKINTVFNLKQKKDETESKYNSAKEEAQAILMTELANDWITKKRPKVGAYEFHLPNGEIRSVIVQNRSKTKSFTPSDAKKAIDQLKPEFKPTDTFDVSTNHTINSDALKTPLIRDRVIQMMTELEAQMKTEGVLPIDVSLVNIKKKCILNDTAIDRVVALAKDTQHLESTLEVLKNPITLNLIE